MKSQERAAQSPDGAIGSSLIRLVHGAEIAGIAGIGKRPTPYVFTALTFSVSHVTWGKDFSYPCYTILLFLLLLFSILNIIRKYRK